MNIIAFMQPLGSGQNRFRCAAGLTAALAILTMPQYAGAQPIIAGSAGSGANSYFFALDFRDFAAPQSYAFEYRSNSTSLFFADVLQGLTSVPTFSIQTTSDPTFGLSLNGIAFAGKQKFNDFSGNNSGDPFGYWAQWNSPDGVNWAFNDFGISTQTVRAGQWVGASWTNEYPNNASPRVLTATASAAPEPGTFTLLAVGAIAGAGIVVRRHRKTAGR